MVALRRRNIVIILPIMYQNYIHYNNNIQVVYYYTNKNLVYLYLGCKQRNLITNLLNNKLESTLCTEPFYTKMDYSIVSQPIIIQENYNNRYNFGIRV